MAFSPDFLTVHVDLPRGADAVTTLDYTHFTVLLDAGRRLARVTGVNVDGTALVDLERGDDWRFDDRVPVEAQTGPEVYANNGFDRGHLVRRRDPVWGVDAKQANSDTFHYTNAAPQASEFNQSAELWLGLENHVLDFASVERLRLNVFTAPVLSPDDPPYRGIRVPLRFWKVIAWVAGGQLASAAFVLDQSPLVPDAEKRSAITDEPELGPFRTFQVAVQQVASLTSLVMPELIAADHLPETVAAEPWRRLRSFSDIVL